MWSNPNWRRRARRFHARWLEERRRRLHAEQALRELLDLERVSGRGDQALEQVVHLCQRMTREVLARSAASEG